MSPQEQHFHEGRSFSLPADISQTRSIKSSMSSHSRHRSSSIALGSQGRGPRRTSKVMGVGTRNVALVALTASR